MYASYAVGDTVSVVLSPSQKSSTPVTIGLNAASPVVSIKMLRLTIVVPTGVPSSVAVNVMVCNPALAGEAMICTCALAEFPGVLLMTLNPGTPYVFTAMFVVCPISGERKSALTTSVSLLPQIFSVSHPPPPLSNGGEMLTIGGILLPEQELK